MTILVTGGTGFAGSHLIDQLLASHFENIHTTTFSASKEETPKLSPENYHQLDLIDMDKTAELIATLKPDWIFNLASFAYVGKSFEKAKELFVNNINLQLSVLEAVRLHSPKSRVLTIGSAEEYGIVSPTGATIREDAGFNPVNPYAVSKTAQDLLANSYFLSYGLDIVRARPFNHIGTHQTIDFAIPGFAKQIVEIERGKQAKLLVGNLDGVRDFTSVDDVVRAYILLMQKGEKGGVYNIGTGIGYTMRDIVKKLSGLSVVPIEIEVDRTRLRPLDVARLVADNTKVRSLGWEPKDSIEEVLRQVLDEWRTKSE